MNSIIFWDMKPCSPLSFNRRFGGTYRLHFQGRRNRFRKPASKQVTRRTTRRHIPEDDTLHNLVVNGNIVLQLIIGIQGVRMPDLRLCECGNEHSGSIKGEELVDWVTISFWRTKLLRGVSQGLNISAIHIQDLEKRCPWNWRMTLWKR
jgi:hypothetical protein